MISFNQANEIIFETLKTLRPKTEFIPLQDALGRTLAEEVTSDVDLPPFDNSAMDGFAVKFNPEVRSWSIKGEIAAGHYNNFSADLISTVSIMTGSRLPEGFDTVIPIEDVFVRESNVILNTNARFIKGMNVSKKGQDLIKGQTALKKGTFLKASQIAALAACGRKEVKVFEKLKIGVLATGDELTEIDQVPHGDKIRASNLYSILSAVKEINMTPVNLGIARDDKEELRRAVESALGKCDILITTGGVSAGKFDFVKDIFTELGIRTVFHKVNIKPGKPLLFGLRESEGQSPQPVFGLPGNPVSSLVTFYLFVRANLMKSLGLPEQPPSRAVLKKSIKKTDSKRHFVRGFISRDELGVISAVPVGQQSSGNLVQMSMSNCLIVIEEERTNPQEGEEVECIMI